MNILNDSNILGESCIWDNFNEKYYWVDIINKKIKSYDGINILENTTQKMPCCISIYNNQLTLALEDEIGIYDFRNNTFNSQLKLKDKNVRFNDGKIDNNGILHIGTMDRNEKDFIGKIYKYYNGYLETLYENIGISNGISFDENNNMFYSDSLSGSIYYKNKLMFKYYELGPDGACYNNKKYYSCLWGGSRIDIFNNLNLIDKLILPVKYPTCCCFGGKNLNKLFITSASILDKSKYNGKCIIIDF